MKISVDEGRVTVKTGAFSSTYTGETQMETQDDGSVIIRVNPNAPSKPSESAKVVSPPESAKVTSVKKTPSDLKPAFETPKEAREREQKEARKLKLEETKKMYPRHTTETLRGETYELVNLYRQLKVAKPPRRFPPGESLMKTEVERLSSRFLRTVDSVMLRLSNICYVLTHGKEGLDQGHEVMIEAVNDWLHNKKKFFKELKAAKALTYKA